MHEATYATHISGHPGGHIYRWVEYICTDNTMCTAVVINVMNDDELATIECGKIKNDHSHSFSW